MGLMEMKLLILFDLEGIIGVNVINDMEHNIKSAYKELNFVINIFRTKGFHRFAVCNIHDKGESLDKEVLKKMGANLIKGVDNLSMVKNCFNYAVMIGFHGKRDSGGYFDHTFRMDITGVFVNDASYGEVGIFYHWLTENDIVVLAVSGEGNFDDEIRDQPCPIHSYIGPLQDEYIFNEYQRLGNILQGIDFKHIVPKCIPRFCNSTLYVTVDNSDKYILLQKKQYCYIKDKCFVFPSVSVFVENLLDFSLALNNASLTIYRKNMRFFIELKKVVPEQRLFLSLKDFGSTDIRIIDHSCRVIISEKVGVTYEDIIDH